MIKLKKLLTEGLLTPESLANAFKKAYISYFDIDDVTPVRVSNLRPPSFLHQYFKINIFISYRAKKFVINHHFEYYKFPKEEIKGLAADEWDEMLRISDKFPPQEATDELVRQNNKLIRFSISIYEISSKEDNYETWEVNSLKKFLQGDYDDEYDVGEATDLRNILGVVETAKKLIDKYISGESNAREEPIDKSPTPVGK
jgi:hypothetical protein